MKLDRNTNPEGKGKYALILLRKNPIVGTVKAEVNGKEKECLVIDPDAVDYGNGPANEFFVIRTKDKFSGATLVAYADEVRKWAARAEANGDNKLADELNEYAGDIFELAGNAFRNPLRRIPD